MELLERHFDIALETPDGIQKLRSLILELAIKGKLVEQHSNEQPAVKLIQEAEQKKLQLIKEGKFKKKQAMPEVKPEEFPFKIPNGWMWTRLSELGEINPRNKADDGLITGFVPMSLVFAEYGKNHKFEERKWGEIKSGFTHFCDNDVGLAKITPCFENGKSCVMKGLPNGIGAGTTELHVFRNTFSIIYPKYVLAFVKSPHFFRTGIPKMTGTAGQKRVPTEHFSSTPFPLPPLAEQHRIVAKIDQLMSLCDKLEAERNERNTKRLKIHTAAINKLLSATDKTAFNSSWNFITKNFSELYSVPENVEELKKAILQLAVMGKLVKQDERDQPAGELVKEIEREKARLVKEGNPSTSLRARIKKQEALPEIRPEEIPYEVPKGWVWVRLGVISKVFAGNSFSSHDFSEKGGTRCIKITNAGVHEFIETNEYLPSDFSAKYEKYLVVEGDIIIALTRPFIKDGLKVCLCPASYNKSLLNQRVAAISCSSKINASYFFEFLKSPIVLTIFKKRFGNTGLQPNLKMKDVVELLFPLPPLPEQRRIVAKINSLLSLCDTLEQSIKNSTDKQTQILNAVLAKL